MSKIRLSELFDNCLNAGTGVRVTFKTLEREYAKILYTAKLASVY